MKKEIYVFDFDGTLTTCDTFIAFIRHVRGTWRCIGSLLLHAPWLIRMKLGLYPNAKAKEKLFAYHFAGMPIEEFDSWCHSFAQCHSNLLRPLAVQTLQEAAWKEIPIWIVSASMENWIRPFFHPFTQAEIHVVGTQPEIQTGTITGRLFSANCNGPEKVRRLAALLPHREQYHITAFGDSSGDKELLAYADVSHYKPFRGNTQSQP